MRHYIPAQLGLDTKQLAEKGVNADIDMNAINQIYDDLFQILKCGLGSKSLSKSTRSKAVTTSMK